MQGNGRRKRREEKERARRSYKGLATFYAHRCLWDMLWFSVLFSHIGGSYKRCVHRLNSKIWSLFRACIHIHIGSFTLLLLSQDPNPLPNASLLII